MHILQALKSIEYLEEEDAQKPAEEAVPGSPDSSGSRWDEEPSQLDVKNFACYKVLACIHFFGFSPPCENDKTTFLLLFSIPIFMQKTDSGE